MSKITKKVLDDIAPKIREALNSLEAGSKIYPSIVPYKTLMTYYYTYIESTGGRTVEQAVRDNLSCGHCRNTIKKYWTNYLTAYGY